jgi:hypothetical protein
LAVPSSEWTAADTVRLCLSRAAELAAAGDVEGARHWRSMAAEIVTDELVLFPADGDVAAA